MSLNLKIEHQCAQCGAPIVLQETDRLFRCEYCRVNAYIVSKGYFRYLLPSNAPKDKELFYFPYWRFKGMQFTYGTNGVEQRFIDFSHQAIDTPGIPMSVGLRSQALKLSFESPEIDGRFLRPSISIRRVMDIFDQRLSNQRAHPVQCRSYIGESISLLYAPFYSDSTLYDAVLNKPLSLEGADAFQPDHLPCDSPGDRIRFLPSLCPACGWDLSGRPDALVLRCNNCDTLWQGTSDGFKPVRFAHVPAGTEETVTYLPFWRIKADISGIKLASYADLVSVANLPKVIEAGFEDVGFRFFIPAFKVRPRTFFRLSNRLTLAQPMEKPVSALPETMVHPVTLPVKEACENLKITLLDFIKPKEKADALSTKIRISPKRYLLMYLPFTETAHEHVWKRYQIAINKNQLKLSAGL